MPRVTNKGQVTLPKAIREALGIVPGSQVDFTIEPQGVVLRKRIADKAIRRWQGHLRGKLPAASVDDFMEQLRDDRAPLPE
jgi:AbrB family looped-hinge helix DNA binding protein